MCGVLSPILSTPPDALPLAHASQHPPWQLAFRVFVKVKKDVKMPSRKVLSVALVLS